MLEPEGIDTVRLRTGRFASMLRFYRDALGCALVRNDTVSGAVRLRAREETIELVRAAAPGTPVTLTVRFRNLGPGARSWLDAFGCGPVDERRDGLELTDPDGNRVRLTRTGTSP